MKWWQQLGSTLKGQLDGLLTPADDPRQYFASAYERQRALWLNVRAALERITASKQRLEVTMAEVRERVQQLEDEARAALVDGREDVARLALRRHMLASAQVQGLERQIHDLRLEEERLSLSEQRLATQIEALRAQQEITLARYSAAEAQLRLKEAFTGISDELTGLRTALQEAEQKTESMQARASAMDRLTEAGLLETPNALVGEPAEWPVRQEDIDRAITERLDAMKRQIEDDRRGPEAAHRLSSGPA